MEPGFCRNHLFDSGSKKPCCCGQCRRLLGIYLTSCYTRPLSQAAVLKPDDKTNKSTGGRFFLNGHSLAQAVAKRKSP